MVAIAGLDVGEVGRFRHAGADCISDRMSFGLNRIFCRLRLRWLSCSFVPLASRRLLRTQVVPHPPLTVGSPSSKQPEFVLTRRAADDFCAGRILWSQDARLKPTATKTTTGRYFTICAADEGCLCRIFRSQDAGTDADATLGSRGRLGLFSRYPTPCGLRLRIGLRIATAGGKFLDLTFR